jgi:hypothetical protein
LLSPRPGRKFASGSITRRFRSADLDKDNDQARKTPAWKGATWRLDADGHHPIKLPIPETEWVEDWSPDGQWFVAGSVRERYPSVHQNR